MTRDLRGIAFGAFLVLVLAFVVLPLAIVVVSSFSSVSYGTWPPPGFSTEWYTNLLEQEGLVAAAGRSLQIAIIATALSLVAGTLAALALVRVRFLGRRAVEGFVLAPLIVPKVAIGFAAFILFARLGWSGSTASLVLAHVVITLPLTVTIAAAGLVRVDRTLEEAARDLGASPAKAFRLATLPQIRPALIAAFVLAFVTSFDEVDTSIFLVAPDEETLPISMYNYAQQYQDPTLAALSTLLIAGSLVLAGAAAVALRRSGIGGALAGRRSFASAERTSR
jgi:putative spermidine/putrescine transport system permease protein